MYRSVDAEGNIVDSRLSSKRDTQAAKRFFKRAFQNTKKLPAIITTDKNASYLPAIDELKKEGFLPKSAVHRTNKYLNNRIEQDHRRIKRGLKSKGLDILKETRQADRKEWKGPLPFFVKTKYRIPSFRTLSAVHLLPKF